MIEQARETRIATARAQLRQALGEMAKAERAVHGATSGEERGAGAQGLERPAQQPASPPALGCETGAAGGRGTAGGQTPPSGQ
jgi:outer membrane protein TolC